MVKVQGTWGSWHTSAALRLLNTTETLSLKPLLSTLLIWIIWCETLKHRMCIGTNLSMDYVSSFPSRLAGLISESAGLVLYYPWWLCASATDFMSPWDSVLGLRA